MTARRDFLRGLAALPLLAGGTATASARGHVSPIEAEFAEYRRLAAIADDLLRAEDEATDRYVEPDRPRHRFGYSEGQWTAGLKDDGRPQLYLDMSDENVVGLRQLIASDVEPGGYADHHRTRQGRAREALAAIEEWKAERQRRRKASGLEDAEAACTAAQEAELEQRDHVHAIPAKTLQDLAVKAMLLRQCDWREDHAAALMDEVIKLAGMEVGLEGRL